MDNIDLVSIIIPCYNQAKFLPYTLESVLDQSFDNWECLVVNDGSTDNTEEIALEFCNRDKRIKYIKKENGGLSSARNAGIKNSKGDFLQFLDSDDLIEKDKTGKTLEAYKKFSERDDLIIYTSSRYFEDSHPDRLKILGRNGLIGHIEFKCYDSLEAQSEALKIRNICVISSPLYPKKVFQTVGYYDEELKAFEDWDFNLRCSNNGFLFHHESIKGSFTLIRLHPASMMTRSDHMKNNFVRFNAKHGVRQMPAKPKRRFDRVRKIIKSLLPSFMQKA